jgi:hypothetical protein
VRQEGGEGEGGGPCPCALGACLFSNSDFQKFPDSQGICFQKNPPLLHLRPVRLLLWLGICKCACIYIYASRRWFSSRPSPPLPLPFTPSRFPPLSHYIFTETETHRSFPVSVFRAVCASAWCGRELLAPNERLSFIACQNAS